jgi:glutathione synthase/RimK-type ligase-like ATP-grasp enzyme
MSQKRSQFGYYLELFDLDNCEKNDETFETNHKVVLTRKSSINNYIPIIEKNLCNRGNWFKLFKVHVNVLPQIDFSFTNLVKFQTKSVVHNRILLDTNHFISNKGFYYDKFKYEEFIPFFKRVDSNLDYLKLENCLVVLKPDDGSLGDGIIILKKCSKESIELHISNNKKFKKWTVTKLFISRLFNKYITSNRMYFLVRKVRTNDKITVSGFWYDEFLNYRAHSKYKDIDQIQSDDEFTKIFVTNYDTEKTVEDFFIKRIITHEEYLNIFTESEYEEIKCKITKYLSIITEQISNHITCSNDYLTNLDSKENMNVTFHLYGVDCLISDNIDIKFIEINGAPSLKNCKGFMNYYVLFDKILELTSDLIFEPMYKVKYSENDLSEPVYGKFSDSKSKIKLFDRKFIPCGKFTKKLKIPVYFFSEVFEKYPFIINGFFNEKRKNKYQKVKNPFCEDIHMFFGPRDLYIRKRSSRDYYDEVLEWNNTKNGRKAKILNKIQGITYFLASKDKLHEIFSSYDFIPKSIIINQLTTLKNEKLENFIENKTNLHLIVKPVYGSQGKGITIVSPSSIDKIIENIILTKKTYGYESFVVSTYISNPKLYNKRKFNIRFYAMVYINNKDIKLYVFNNVLVYFTMLPYENNINDTIYALEKIGIDSINKLTILDIQKMTHITNLQIVKDIAKKLNIDIPIDDFVLMLENFEYSKEFINYIKEQGKNIIKTTVSKVKHELRPLNRFVPKSSAFNLIAYDTMLDSNNKLHLIEINRGPDLFGLKFCLGDSLMEKIFSELFDIVVDEKQGEFNYFSEILI